jgi:hypothetical protein
MQNGTGVALWPFALKYAILLSNTLSMDENGNTPLSKFTSTPVDSTNLDLQNFHTFGCPCYVLDHHLQSGSIGPPKWDPRLQLRIFVGFPPHHSRTVAMVLNPNTGLVSPQFHVVFDDHFRTLKFLCMDTTPQFWSDLCHNLEPDSSDFDLHPATTVPMDAAAAPSHHGGDDVVDNFDSGGGFAPNDEQDIPESLGRDTGDLVIPSGGVGSLPREDDFSHDKVNKDKSNGAYQHWQFLNLETVGLWRSSRDPKLSDKAKSSSMNFKKNSGIICCCFCLHWCPIYFTITLSNVSLHSYHRSFSRHKPVD